MLQIIRTEWLKVRSYRTFWVLLALTVTLIPAINYMFAETTAAIKSQSQGMLDFSAYDFPNTWQTTVFASRFTSVVPGFLLIILVANEFTFRTNRQNIIDGWDRKQFIWAKVFWLLLLTLLATIVAVATAISFGASYGTRSFSMEGSHYILYFMLQTALSLSLALLITVLVRRAGLAIVLYLSYVMVIEKILVTVINRNMGRFGRLLPLETGSRLIGWPVVGKFVGDADGYDASTYILMAGVYMAIALWLISRRLLKVDL